MKKILLLSFLMVSFSFAQNQETINDESHDAISSVMLNDDSDSETPKYDVEPEIKPDAFIKKCVHNTNKKLLYTEFDCPNNYTQITNDWLNDTNMTSASSALPSEEKASEEKASEEEVEVQ